MHSKFTSGQLDGRGNPKPFFNITKGKVNIAIRATDIDRKDISMKENNSDDYFRSFVASKYDQTLMKKMRLQDYLNEWDEDTMGNQRHQLRQVSLFRSPRHRSC